MVINTGKFLRENLFQSSIDLRQRRRFTFQQDNDPKHTAKTTLEWFKGKHLNVEEWAKIPVTRCAKLIETYPMRLAAVIAAKGGSTKY